MSDTQLKPCPFCGGEPSINHSGYLGGTSQCQVFCNNKDCGTETTQFLGNDLSVRESAIRAWNKRPVEDKLKAENAELKGRVIDLLFIIENNGIDEKPKPEQSEVEE